MSLISAWKARAFNFIRRAVAAELDGLRAGVSSQLQRIEDRQRDAATARSRIEGLGRRALAEQKLWSQLSRIDGLDLTDSRRSVLFLHNSYYHFFYLARALRLRGWRAVSLSLEDPNGAHRNYYHGEDVNMWDVDPVQFQANQQVVFEFAKQHFDLMHFAGDGLMSFFRENFPADEPADIIEWKKLGKKLAYSISGCNSATAQSSVTAWSAHDGLPSVCDNCHWQGRPDVCSDEKSLAWGRKVNRFCDLVFSELQPSLDYLSSRHANVVRGPVTLVVDERFWSPGLNVPEALRLPRAPGEVLVYHAFGNYGARRESDRNIKGTPAIVAAVDRLQQEGYPVRLIFFSKLPNEWVRYFQAQADIVVDQLWAGSWGANGRESLMLGKPVIGYVNDFEHDPADVLEAIRTTPVVHASVNTVYDVLKDLVADPVRRAEVGRRSRDYALKWHSATAGSERYEQAFDRMLARTMSSEQPLQSVNHEAGADLAA